MAFLNRYGIGNFLKILNIDRYLNLLKLNNHIDFLLIFAHYTNPAIKSPTARLNFLQNLSSFVNFLPTRLIFSLSKSIPLIAIKYAMSCLFFHLLLGATQLV